MVTALEMEGDLSPTSPTSPGMACPVLAAPHSGSGTDRQMGCDGDPCVRAGGKGDSSSIPFHSQQPGHTRMRSCVSVKNVQTHKTEWRRGLLKPNETVFQVCCYLSLPHGMKAAGRSFRAASTKG